MNAVPHVTVVDAANTGSEIGGCAVTAVMISLMKSITQLIQRKTIKKRHRMTEKGCINIRTGTCTSANGDGASDMAMENL